MRRFGLLIVSFLAVLMSFSASAQQDNLLRDPGFEGNYTGRGRGDFNIPEAWGGWWTDQPSTESWQNVAPLAFPHTAGFKRAGGNSLSIGRGGGTFTAAVFQQVPNVPAGTQLRATISAFMENAADSNAQIRIGIGSNVGGNPLAGSITWSGWYSTVNNWLQPTVDATASGGEVTVFVYMTQTWPNDPNAVYLDEASLVVTGQGEVPAEADGETGEGEAAAPPPPPQTAPIVAPQAAGDDGTIRHTIQPGDTIAAIAVAYGVPMDQVLALNDISNPGLIRVGQELIVATPDPNASVPPPTLPPTAEPTVTPSAIGPIVGSTELAPTLPPPTPNASPTTQAVIPTPLGATMTPNVPAPTLPPGVTPTTPPPAPVVPGDADVDPTSPLSTLCVLMFEDRNQNRIRESNEGLLANGIILVRDAQGIEVVIHMTDGVNEPACFDDIPAGTYTASATAPQEHGMTTPANLLLSIQPGMEILLPFGAARGITTAAVPTPDASALTAPTMTPIPELDGDAFSPEMLEEFSGLLVFGLAGFVLVAGLGLSAFMQR